MSDPKLVDMAEFSRARGSLDARANIIGIGGGKGGVGKSFVSSNIAIFLANMGFKTILVDLDLGGANAHTTLGEGMPKVGLGDFVSGKVDYLEKVAVGTKFSGLRLISGCNDDLEIANMQVDGRSQLMSAIYNLNADFIVLDLSAGTHQSTIDFFLMANLHLVVFTPEPSSIENAYRFMKAAYYRKIKRYERQLGIQNLVKELMGNREGYNIKSPADLMHEVLKQDPARGQKLLEKMESLCFKIVLNQTRTYKDVDVGESVKSVCNKFFGLDANFIGHLEYDNAVWQSLRKHRPLLLEYPHSRLYGQILSITKAIAYPNQLKAAV